MNSLSSTFWLENPIILCKEMKFLPKKNMTCEEQNNSITRLVFFIFLIMYLLQYKYSTLFLILSLIFIIILYYFQKNKMTTTYENYSEKSHFNYIKKSENLYKKGIN